MTEQAPFVSPFGRSTSPVNGGRPRIVVTGLSHAGLSLMGAMLEAGGATYTTVADPHLPPAAAPDGPVIGLFIERGCSDIARSWLKAQGFATAPFVTLASIRLRINRDQRAAEAAAAQLFAPVFLFRFAVIVADPLAQAWRLARLFSGPQYRDLGPAACPNFSAPTAALAVRRILPPDRPRHSHGPLRLAPSARSTSPVNGGRPGDGAP